MSRARLFVLLNQLCVALHILADGIADDLHGGVAVEIDTRQGSHAEQVFGLFLGKEKLLDGGAALDIFLEHLVQALGLQLVIVLDPARVAVEMIQAEAQLLVVEIHQVGRTGGLGQDGLIVIGVDLGEADLIDGQIGHDLLAVEAGVMIIEVRVHVREGGEGEIHRTLAVGTDVDAVGAVIQRRGRCGRDIGDALVADERHAVIIDIGHAGLQEAHLVREGLELAGHEDIIVYIDSGRRIAVGESVLARSGVGDGHRGTGKDDGLEIRRRDVRDIRHVVIETERHLGVRGDLGHHGHDPLGVAAAVGLLIGHRIQRRIHPRAASHRKGHRREDKKGTFTLVHYHWF